MLVSDNGVGLQNGARAKTDSFGLIGIEERVSILGGAFSVTSEQGIGTTVRVSVPLQADSALAATAPQSAPLSDDVEFS